MVRESGIAATRPIFPSYLLSSFTFSFARRHSTSSTLSTASSSSLPVDSQGCSAVTTPNNSPPNHDGVTFSKPRRLSRTAADTLRCSTCSTDLALSSQIVSKGFTGRYGRAYLVAPPERSTDQSLLNIRVGKNESRQLVTGWHTVADISCGICARKLGWKYVDAKEESQKYKVGKFILETERVVAHRSWDDIPTSKDMEVFQGDSRTDESEDEIKFDSEDEDECDDIFAGVWDPETVAKRRSRMVGRQKTASET